MRARIKQLLPHLYLIDDAGDSTCYVLCGRERAALIDTVNGAENLLDVVRTITNLPLVTINTHGHVDHIGGNFFLEEAWLHPADEKLAEAHFGFFSDMESVKGLKPCPFRFVQVGQILDLGGVELEVIPLAGHTPGSIGLLDRKDRILFTGDGMNPHIWMQLEESLPIRCLLDTLNNVKANYYDAFDRVLYGHAKDFLDKSICDRLIRGCTEMLNGEREQDMVYRYFAGECLQHPYADNPAEVIVYSKDKL